MRVLLTGFTGRIGPAVLDELYCAGYAVRGLVEPGACLDESWRDRLVDVLWGDIRNVCTWAEGLKGVDSVVHLAGPSGEVPEAFATNVTAARLMVQACHELQVRSIVFASSSCVLGQCDRIGNPPYEVEFLPIDETHPLKPNADYGLSKLAAEQVIHAGARRWGLQAIALRPAFVLTEDAIRRRVWQEFDDCWHLAQLWAYTHVLDCAAAFRQALEPSACQPFEAMYITAADTLSETPTAELVDRCLPRLNGAAQCLPGHSSLYCWQRAESLIGYRPKHSWRDCP